MKRLSGGVLPKNGQGTAYAYHGTFASGLWDSAESCSGGAQASACAFHAPCNSIEPVPSPYGHLLYVLRKHLPSLLPKTDKIRLSTTMEPLLRAYRIIPNLAAVGHKRTLAPVGDLLYAHGDNFCIGLGLFQPFHLTQRHVRKRDIDPFQF